MHITELVTIIKAYVMVNRKFIGFLFALFWVCLQAHGQEYHNSFDKLNTQNGLSQNDVRALYQDSRGHIWIGTHDGLNRYNGYDVKVFRKNPGDTTSLRSSLISSIAEDSLGNIWVGTDDEGLSMLSRKTGKFTHFRNTPDRRSLLSNNHITALLIDKEGMIWAGTPTGLNCLSVNYQDLTVSSEQYKSTTDTYGSINGDRIIALYQDKLGNVWIGSSGGLMRYLSGGHDQKAQFLQYNTNPAGLVRSIQETPSSLLVISNSLLELPFSEINKSNPEFNEICQIPASRMLTYDESAAWVTSGTGVRVISLLEPSEEVLAHFRHYWGNDASLSKDITTCIMKDKSGIIWIGTNGSGVNIYKPNRKNFRHYSRNEHPGSLSFNKIRSIYEDSEKNLWIGTEGGKGLNFLSKKNSKAYDEGFNVINVSANSDDQNFVYAIDEIKSSNENTITIGANHPSLFQYGKISKASKGVFYSGDKRINGVGPVFSILIDRNEVIWLGTYQEGLLRYELDEKGNVLKADIFRMSSENNSSISSDIIRSLAEDHEGNIWVGTGNGVNKLTPSEQSKEDPEFIKYFHDPEYKYSISHNYILPIYVTRTGQIWIGTLGGGLNKVIKGENSETDHFLSYTTLDGLPNNVIKAILEDDNGYLWCSSNAGLTRFSPEKLEFKNFGLDDGLQDLEFSELAAFKRSDGELLFGGVNGFNAFYPKEIVSDSFDVDLVFENLQILNQDIGIGDTLNGRVILNSNINNTKELRLNYVENSFSLGFSTLHYASPLQNQYAYMLEGFDSDWIYTSALNRTAKYTNLPPGDYILKVKASNGDGYWSEKQLSLDIIINTPWWGSYWAIAVYIVLFLVGLWFFRKFTIITNSKKNEYLMEHFEKEKVEELSQLKLRFFTNISHEFRTPLTLIIGFIERLKSHSAKLSENDRQKYYQNIFRNSKVLLSLINQLMGFRKLEQGKMKLRVSYNDLTNYISLLGENFYEMANKKQIDFNVRFEQSIITWFDAEIIERVMFNLLSNAFKFTPENGQISVFIRKDNDHVFIEVKDNGRGIPKEIQERLFERFANSTIQGESSSGIGLSFIKSLIEMHHGEIVYETGENQGTTFKVTLPNAKIIYSPEEILVDSDASNEDEMEQWLLPSEDDGKRISKPVKQKVQTLLLVEDHDDILFFLEENFKDSYNIFKAHEGGEALEICLEQSIDLVISDIMMEGMDGFEFCEKLKADERINHIPIILLTAKDTSEHKIKGYSLGAEAYIAKPFSLQELEARLDSLLESRKNIIGKFKNQMDLSPSEVGLTSIDEKFLKRVMAYIEENISSSEFSVEMLARECGLSQIHLNKKLKALVGNTANSFIRSIRIKRAAQLLKKNMYSVAEIMYEVGFNDAKYFRDCFKKEFGMTPSDYQKSEAMETGQVEE
ncbi:MAG: response regulator [Cyclobacteriaceae bacterium]